MVREGWSDYPLPHGPGTGRVEPPRFTVTGTVPTGTRFQVTDSHHVRVTAPDDAAVDVTLRAAVDGRERPVVVPAGTSRTVTVLGASATPTSDLSRGRTTFPTSPLPEGMTEPSYAVDADPGTAWRPGPSGRMVVDLGQVHDLTEVGPTWSAGRRRPVTVEVSDDGLDYRLAAEAEQPGPVTALPLTGRARYVAVAVAGWDAGDAELVHLSVAGD